MIENTGFKIVEIPIDQWDQFFAMLVILVVYFYLETIYMRIS